MKINYHKYVIKTGIIQRAVTLLPPSLSFSLPLFLSLLPSRRTFCEDFRGVDIFATNLQQVSAHWPVSCLQTTVIRVTISHKDTVPEGLQIQLGPEKN